MAHRDWAFNYTTVGRPGRHRVTGSSFVWLPVTVGLGLRLCELSDLKAWFRLGDSEVQVQLEVLCDQ